MPIKIPYLVRRDWQQQTQINELYQNQRFLIQGASVVAATPTFNPTSGSFATTLAVTISSTDVGASLYYTLDGTTPNSGSFAYTVPVVLSATTTLKAIAIVSGYVNSAVASQTYTKTVATYPIYWGWSTNRTLTEAQILALTAGTDSNPYGNRTFPAATVSDYAFFWWPDTFADVATNPNGFLAGSFPIPMATNVEGFTTLDAAGYYYLPTTVNGVLGRQYGSYYQIGGASSQIFTVAA
jgi:hypothetical protein